MNAYIYRLRWLPSICGRGCSTGWRQSKQAARLGRRCDSKQVSSLLSYPRSSHIVSSLTLLSLTLSYLTTLSLIFFSSLHHRPVDQVGAQGKDRRRERSGYSWAITVHPSEVYFEHRDASKPTRRHRTTIRCDWSGSVHHQTLFNIVREMDRLCHW